MQITAIEPGHALCRGRGQQRRINTALVGTLTTGDWVLVFMDSAQEHISPERAQEVNATLDLIDAALSGGGPVTDLDAAAGFALPSAMSHTQLLALTGARP